MNIKPPIYWIIINNNPINYSINDQNWYLYFSGKMRNCSLIYINVESKKKINNKQIKLRGIYSKEENFWNA